MDPRPRLVALREVRVPTMSEDRHLTAEEEIAFWFFDWFLDLTHDVQKAQELVMLGYSPRDLEDLLLRECPLELAEQILKPV